MGDYTIATERLAEVHETLTPLFREHYQEMSDRLAGEGIHISPFNPRTEDYLSFAASGMLKTFVLRHDGKPCGYANVYVTADMHNRDLIAQEDTLFVSKAHRNGIGRKLSLFVIAALKDLGVKRFTVTAVTDTRATKLWKRIGFKPVATQMIYEFEGR